MKKFYYNRFNGDNKGFWSALKKVRESAIKVTGVWSDFYYTTTYTLANGVKVEYMEDAEYGIPYSLEWLGGEI